MSDLLEVRDLKKYFKTPRGTLHAVDGISFNLKAGETLGVVGESGCGKSTLGRTVIRLLQPTSGTVIFKGEDIGKLSSRKEKHRVAQEMQMIFQDPYSSLDPRMSVWRLIADPLIINHIYKDKNELNVAVANLMDTVGLSRRFTYSFPHELDGGRRQRIGIARALALDPSFIVCDEPVSALDVSIQAQILNLLQDLQADKQLTYIFITHDLSVVRHISNHILVMYLGCMVELCESKELFKLPLHPYTKGLLSAIPVASIDYEKKQVIMSGEITSPIDPEPCCRFAKRCPYATERCFKEEPKYEEALPGHFVACHRVREINDLPVRTSPILS